MDQRKDTTDELYVLGLVVGQCNEQPRDELLLDDMLLYLQAAQKKRLEFMIRCADGAFNGAHPDRFGKGNYKCDF
jgi:hypothetical protein